MAVVVNEFEVIAEPPPAAARAAAAPAASPPPRVPDIDLLLAERRSREERVRAY
jgi:hypothetical protein